MTYSSEEAEMIERIRQLPKMPMTSESSRRVMAALQHNYPRYRRQESYRSIIKYCSIGVIACACVLGFFGLVQQHRIHEHYASSTEQQNQPIDSGQLMEAHYEGISSPAIRVYSDKQQKVYIHEGSRTMLLYEAPYILSGSIHVYHNPDQPSSYYLYVQEKQGNKVVPHLLLAEGDRMIAEIRDLPAQGSDTIAIDWSPNGNKVMLMLTSSTSAQTALGVVEEGDYRFKPIHTDTQKPFLLGWKDDATYWVYQDRFFEIQTDSGQYRELTTVSLPDPSSRVIGIMPVRGAEPSALLTVGKPSGAAVTYQLDLKTERFSEIGFTEAPAPEKRIVLGEMPGRKQLVAEIRESSIQFVETDPGTKTSEVKLTKQFQEQAVQLDTPLRSPDGAYVAVRGTMPERQEQFLLVFSLVDGLAVYEESLDAISSAEWKWIQQDVLQIGSKTIQIKGE